MPDRGAHLLHDLALGLVCLLALQRLLLLLRSRLRATSKHQRAVFQCFPQCSVSAIKAAVVELGPPCRIEGGWRSKQAVPTNKCCVLLFAESPNLETMQKLDTAGLGL